MRSLIDEGNNFAQAVGLSAGTFYETDQYVEGTLKVAANAMTGNPHLTEDEVTQMGWGDLAKNHMLADPDYSGESYQQAADNIKQGWQDASNDVMTSDIPGMTGMPDRQFVPSPEERAAAAEAQAEGQKNGDVG